MFHLKGIYIKNPHIRHSLDGDLWLMEHFRCRDNITPLYASCINSNIPIDIIRLLLRCNANPNNKIKSNGITIDMKNGIIHLLSKARGEYVPES